MIAEKDPYINSAYQKLQVISQDKEKRLEYEAREKAIRDYNQFLSEAEQRGIEIGERRGIEIGEQRGIEIGERRGIEIGEQRGIEIATARINKLHGLLIQEKRFDDLARSIEDMEFQDSLFHEFGI